ncbi:MAG TPA: type II secretion system major pseudopilin GspG [Anaeromyxobacteraceae bacterium]|nr:type II secretion system major pseudopilin GspG [Anaeromyxobacteraceae bacterium]
MNARKRRAQRGMTLIEIMVVVIIIGLIGTAVAVNVFGNLAEAKVRTAKTDLAKISEAVDTYKVLRGRYPTTEEGLNLLIQEKILKPNKNGKILDPWDRDYIYLSPGQAHPDAYDVKTYGADGAPGGDGENADLVNN